MATNQLLVISSQYRPRHLLSSLTIGCSVVQSSASACNLGVVFDNGLTFEKHITAMQGSKFTFDFGSTCVTKCKFLGALPEF